MRDAIRVAIGSVPKDGGTFSFYRGVREKLRGHGVEMRCVTLGRKQAALVEPEFSDEGCVTLAPRSVSLKAQARAFVDWCEQEAIDIVIGINSPGVLAALPHLPQRLRVVSRCASASSYGYCFAMIGAERLAAMVALSPGLRDGLIETCGADVAQIRLIPNGVDLERFGRAAPKDCGCATGRIELGYLGRIHPHKGVTHLPDLADALCDMGVGFRLRVAGKGIYRDSLKAAMRAHVEAGRVKFVGALSPTEVPTFLRSVQVFLFPSHFEGCPNALLEALAAGCVPFAWRLPGVTDYVIEEARTGYLFDLGDTGGMAHRIAALVADRALLNQMSEAAARSARERFSSGRCAAAYADLFAGVMARPAPAWTPRAWSAFWPEPALRGSRWSWALPRGWVRRWSAARLKVQGVGFLGTGSG